MEYLLYYLVVFFVILFSIMFMSLLERKILGYIQMRKGPNFVGLLGMLQPISDAVKLFLKEEFLIGRGMNLMYFWVPFYMFSINLLIWFIYPFETDDLMFISEGFFIMCLLSLSVYYLMYMGWSSNSVYSILGAIRSMAQTISYEISLSLLFFFLFFFSSGSGFEEIEFYQFYFINFFFMWPLMGIWIILVCAELNRTPFDFAEGESELVSGFNVEYSGVKFSLIFMVEYSNMLFMSTLFIIYFLSNKLIFLYFILLWIFSMMLLSIRSMFPRFRYDLLMYLVWKEFMLYILGFFFLILIFEINIIYMN
uniref:NADH-ubiquinone oxidoreductase chain 1 n=1 Tax=Cephalonomia gallicola TaxID=627714 RepID=E0WCE1_9HYME|nr:NADH dehydrogenase subunit 1 [Cephalonomia gallicola]